jgi:hypothetical protein
LQSGVPHLSHFERMSEGIGAPPSRKVEVRLEEI